MRRHLLLFLLLISLTITPQPAAADGPGTVYLPLVLTPLAAPVLKWANGGCYSSWCETGWYSSPAAVDVNGDGIQDVVASAYSLVALDGKTGALIWRSGGTGRRTWPGIAVADLERNGPLEIIIAQSGGLVSVYNLDGSLKWQKQPAGTSGELRGMLVEDLDGNNSALEVLVTRAGGSEQNTWVLEANGSPRPGWPRLPLPDDNTTGYAWGVYNANPAAGNLSGDGRKEIVVPSDVHYINVYLPDGTPLMANAIFGTKTWGQVGVWESTIPEQRGWGACNGARAESYRTNFADGPAVISDVNGDGQAEVIVTGNMYDCHAGYPPSRYMALYLFNADRTRYNQDGNNWSSIPVDTGAPLSEDYDIIESVAPNPVVADLDGDGKQEILYASYDGRLHAFWLDKTEHGAWPYAVTKAGEGVFRFASEPVVVDLDNDGKAEVLFTSWTQKGSGRTGRLHLLNWAGAVLYEIDLPAPRSATWNGALGAPTLAEIDGDADLEIILNTAHSGVVVYDLPGSAGARILWGTGRGNQQRSGAR